MIIIFAALLLTLAGVFIFIPKIKRKKLAEGLYEYIKSAFPKADLTMAELNEGLAKLTNSEIDTFIDFATKMKEKNLLGAAPLLRPMGPILVKSGLAGKIM